jgi:hypothetical protein
MTLPFDLPEKHKVTSSIKYLLGKMCQSSRENRMTKDEFMELNLNNFSSLIDLNERLKTQPPKRRPRIFSVGKFDKESQRSQSKAKIEAEYNTNRKNSRNTPKV